ncbi:MAG: hypothetical protein ABJB01_03825 [Rudaea sp.]
MVAAALALVVGIFVTSRTLLLTGMPTIGPDALVRVWRAFGFGLTFPTGTMNWMKPPDWNDVPALAVDVLFRPQLLLNHITFWNANIWFWAACAVLLLPRLASNNRPQTLPLFATGLSVVVCGLLLLFGISYGVRGGDGNYYISAVVIATILALVTITRRLPSSQLMTTCLIAFVSFHMCVSFISADWMSGTRAFDLKFNRSVRTFRHTNRQLLASNGLYAIEQYLKHLHRPVRVVGCMEDNLNMRLSARTESIQQIAYSRVDFLASPKAFLDFLQDDKIDFFIVPAVGNSSAYCYDNSEVREATDALLHDERVDKINDMGYVLLDLSTWSQLRQR